MKPNPNIAFILAFFFPGVDRMYIGQPGLGVFKLIVFVTAPLLGVFVGVAGGIVAFAEDWTTGGVLGVGGLAAVVALCGAIWWVSDLFLIRDAACKMGLKPHCGEELTEPEASP